MFYLQSDTEPLEELARLRTFGQGITGGSFVGPVFWLRFIASAKLDKFVRLFLKL